MTRSLLIAKVAGRLRVALPFLAIRFSKVDRMHLKLPRLQGETEACREALLRFGAESDKDFTALANGMGVLNRHLADLRGKTEQLDRILQDQDEDRAISSAYLLYKNAVDLVHSSVGIAVSEQEQMHQIGQALLQACGAREKFHRNHLMLRILAMNMRMESVRLEPEYQAVFVNIAAAIAEIDEKIVTSTEGAFTRIEVVIAEAGSAHGQSKNLEENLHRCAQESIEKIQRELANLKTALMPCAEQSRGIVDLIKQTGPQILRMIGSLQHQDIVRQQLEHVASGFEDLSGHIGSKDTPDSATGALDESEYGYVHGAASVQRAHLQSSRQEIEKAAEEVSAGLRSLLAICQPLMERFAKFEESAVSAFSDCRVARIFAEEIQQLVQIADKSEAANDKSSHLVGQIEEVVQVFSQEIASHELDVKLVALNAQVAAARMLRADSLGRIAEEIGLVADENAKVTQELTGDLRASLDRLHGIKTGAAEFIAVISRERSDLQRSVVEVSGKLERLEVRIRSDSACVRRDFETVYQQNEALLEGLGFSKLIESCYAPAERLCQQMLEATSSYAGAENLNAAAAAKLETHRSRYTMVKENATHVATLGIEQLPPSADLEPELFAENPVAQTGTVVSEQPAPSAKSDFGDGIDLF